MIFEARLAFLAFFFLCWMVVGLLPWAIAAVGFRGRGSFVALPLAVGGACAAGLVVPLLGARDVTGFWMSLGAALGGGAAGAAGGAWFAARMPPSAAGVARLVYRGRRRTREESPSERQGPEMNAG